MKPKIKAFLAVVLLGLTMSSFASAALINCGGYLPNGTKQTDCKVSDLIFTVERIINFLLAWAWLVSIFFILWAGWEMINAGGNEEKITKGKETLRNAIIGFVLIMMSYLLMNFIVGILIGQGNPDAGKYDIIRSLLPKP